MERARSMITRRSAVGARLQSATSIDPVAIKRIVYAAFKYGLIDKAVRRRPRVTD